MNVSESANNSTKFEARYKDFFTHWIINLDVEKDNGRSQERQRKSTDKNFLDWRDNCTWDLVGEWTDIEIVYWPAKSQVPCLAFVQDLNQFLLDKGIQLKTAGNTYALFFYVFWVLVHYSSQLQYDQIIEIYLILDPFLF